MNIYDERREKVKFKYAKDKVLYTREDMFASYLREIREHIQHHYIDHAEREKKRQEYLETIDKMLKILSIINLKNKRDFYEARKKQELIYMNEADDEDFTV